MIVFFATLFLFSLSLSSSILPEDRQSIAACPNGDRLNFLSCWGVMLAGGCSNALGQAQCEATCGTTANGVACE